MGANTDPLRELESELADFWRRGRSRTRRRAQEIHPKLDPACYPLLMVLARDDSVRMSELAAALDLEKSTVTRQVDAVVRLGLAERGLDPDDARARTVRMTDEGRQRFDAVVQSAVDDWRLRLSQWNPDDIRTLSHLLRRLNDSDDNATRDAAST